MTDLVGGQFKFAVLDIRGPEEYVTIEGVIYIHINYTSGVRECFGRIR